jgi:hypothetical protein
MERLLGAIYLHMAIAWNASPISTTRPLPRRPFGGGQSDRSTSFTSVSIGMLNANDRNGSAHVAANAWMSSNLAAFVAGTLVGEALLKKPPRNGHDTQSWPLYLSPLWELFPGASSTAMNG